MEVSPVSFCKICNGHVASYNECPNCLEEVHGCVTGIIKLLVGYTYILSTCERCGNHYVVPLIVCKCNKCGQYHCATCGFPVYNREDFFCNFCKTSIYKSHINS